MICEKCKAVYSYAKLDIVGGLIKHPELCLACSDKLERKLAKKQGYVDSLKGESIMGITTKGKKRDGRNHSEVRGDGRDTVPETEAEPGDREDGNLHT